MSRAVLAEGLEPLRTPIGRIRPDPANPNKHPKRQIEQIALSLQEFGQDQPIVCDAQGVIAKGEGRYLAAKALGWEDVAVAFVDDDELRRVRRNIADNQTAKLAEMDAEALLALVQVQETPAPGFDEEAVRELLELAGGRGKELQEDYGPQLDKAEELRQKWGVESGQMWQLGEHRLICGDCTDRAVVEGVMGGDRAALFATDPPYGANAGSIGFTAQRDELELIANDDLVDTTMQRWLETVFHAWVPALNDNAAWYLWHPMLTQGYFAAAAAAAAVIIHRQIIWVKEQFIFGRGDYHWQHELCFFGWIQGHRPPFYGERNQSTVWNVPWSVKRSEVGHPTAKPSELWDAPIRNHTRPGEICAEPFSGSGAQIIACERLGRRCRAVEISPAYCAVAIQRWADLTGETPILINEGAQDG